MQAKKLAGPEAGSQKYDILTALGTLALTGPPGFQRLVLRFLTLITARYNWRQGTLHVGQREIARLWSVDERTVKREMAKLRGLGWLTVEMPARRGRVASYALDLIAIRSATRDEWKRVGPDFEARMRGVQEQHAGGTVVPFPGREAVLPALPESDPTQADPVPGGDGWDAVRSILRADDPAVFLAWFEALRSGGAGEGLTLVAPTAFHASYVRTHYSDRLVRALVRAGVSPGELRILAPHA